MWGEVQARACWQKRTGSSSLYRTGVHVLYAEGVALHSPGMGLLTDPANDLIVTALMRGAAAPGGLPLFAGRAGQGFFASTSVARQAAQRCKDNAYIEVVRVESRGKSIKEVCAVTEKGLAYLLSQVEKTLPRTIIRQPSTNGNGVNGTPAISTLILDVLARWHASGAIEDCALSELYRQARQQASSLTIGQFHDALRTLHEHQRIYLHPWTGPLYELPEPALALLVGHEVAYYASKK